MNKWLIIIIILIIAFIIIPFLMFMFNIKEGVTNEDKITNKEINENVDKIKNKIENVSSNVKDVKGTLNDVNKVSEKLKESNKLITKTSGTVSNVKDDTKKLLRSRATETSAITKNDNINRNLIIHGGKNNKENNMNLTKIYKEIQDIKSLNSKGVIGSPIDFKLNFDNNKFNKLERDISRNMFSMSNNIVAYNSANLENAKAIQNVNQNVKSAKDTYLSKIKNINKHMEKINNKMKNIDFNKLNDAILSYNTSNVDLNSTLLSKFDVYEKDMLSFKNKIYKRLLINDDPQ
jgi:hypothetical protein